MQNSNHLEIFRVLKGSDLDIPHLVPGQASLQYVELAADRVGYYLMDNPVDSRI